MRLNIGLDLHGVLDTYTDIFKEAIQKWLQNGHIIHVVTGIEVQNARAKLSSLEMPYDDIFSIVDYNRSLGTHMWRDEKGTWWMDEEKWFRSKGEYARLVNMDVYFDNETKYVPYFPDYCTYILVPKTNFHLLM